MLEILVTSISLSNSRYLLKFRSRDYYSISEIQFSSPITALPKYFPNTVREK